MNARQKLLKRMYSKWIDQLLPLSVDEIYALGEKVPANVYVAFAFMKTAKEKKVPLDKLFIKAVEKGEISSDQAEEAAEILEALFETPDEKPNPYHIQMNINVFTKKELKNKIKQWKKQRQNSPSFRKSMVPKFPPKCSVCGATIRSKLIYMHGRWPECKKCVTKVGDMEAFNLKEKRKWGKKMKKYHNPISASTGSIVVIAAVAAGFYFWWKNRPIEQRIVASLNPATVRKLMSDLDASSINSSVAIPNASQDWMTA